MGHKVVGSGLARLVGYCPIMTNAAPNVRLTRKEISRLVHNWIGVSGGYLGDFSYTRHDRFWLDVCDVTIDTGEFPGTTRECFEATLFAASAAQQAAVLRAILEDYPRLEVVDEGRRNFRTPGLYVEIQSWIARLETGQVAVEVDLASTTDIVRRALDDADILVRNAGPPSAVDRVHTALHGYLHALCREAGLELAGHPTMNQLFKALRANHPALSQLGSSAEEVSRVLQSMATILDALNPVRNSSSVAHPNAELIGEPEAVLVINTVRTLLGYLEAKRRFAQLPPV